MTDQMTGHENAGHEIAGMKMTDVKLQDMKLQDMKMQDMKQQDIKEQDMKLTQKWRTFEAEQIEQIQHCFSVACYYSDSKNIKD